METKLLSPAELIRVKTKIADEWREAEWEARSTQIRADYLQQCLTDSALITGLLIEAISKLDALIGRLTLAATSTQAPAPTSAKDCIDVSPVVWKATDTP